MFWVPKPLTNYFKMSLHVGITFRVRYSPKDYFRMNLHVDITFKLQSSFRGTQTTCWAFRNDLTCGYYI
jgi:hypothetical protein